MRRPGIIHHHGRRFSQSTQDLIDAFLLGARHNDHDGLILKGVDDHGHGVVSDMHVVLRSSQVQTALGYRQFFI